MTKTKAGELSKLGELTIAQRFFEAALRLMLLVSSALRAQFFFHIRDSDSAKKRHRHDRSPDRPPRRLASTRCRRELVSRRGRNSPIGNASSGTASPGEHGDILRLDVVRGMARESADERTFAVVDWLLSVVIPSQRHDAVTGWEIASWLRNQAVDLPPSSYRANCAALLKVIDAYPSSDQDFSELRQMLKACMRFRKFMIALREARRVVAMLKLGADSSMLDAFGIPPGIRQVLRKFPDPTGFIPAVIWKNYCANPPSPSTKSHQARQGDDARLSRQGKAPESKSEVAVPEAETTKPERQEDKPREASSRQWDDRRRALMAKALP